MDRTGRLLMKKPAAPAADAKGKRGNSKPKWLLQSNAFQAALKAMRAFKRAVYEETSQAAGGAQVMMLPLVMKFGPPCLPTPCKSCGCDCAAAAAKMDGNMFLSCQNVQPPKHLRGQSSPRKVNVRDPATA